LALASLNGIMFVLWWDKPLGAQTILRVYLKCKLTDAERNSAGVSNFFVGASIFWLAIAATRRSIVAVATSSWPPINLWRQCSCDSWLTVDSTSFGHCYASPFSIRRIRLRLRLHYLRCGSIDLLPCWHHTFLRSMSQAIGIPSTCTACSWWPSAPSSVASIVQGGTFLSPLMQNRSSDVSHLLAITIIPIAVLTFTFIMLHIILASVDARLPSALIFFISMLACVCQAWTPWTHCGTLEAPVCQYIHCPWLDQVLSSHLMIIQCCHQPKNWPLTHCFWYTCLYCTIGQYLFLRALLVGWCSIFHPYAYLTIYL